MKTIIKRSSCLFIALIMCMSLGSVAFATEPNSETVPDNNNQVIEITPRGSIGGYAQATINSTTNTVTIVCDSSAIFDSGMGMTIKTSNASFSGSVKARGYARKGIASSFNGVWVPMGRETLVQNLTHRGLDVYVIEFSEIPKNGSFMVQVYIYG